MADQKARIVISAVDQTRAAFASVERNVADMESALGSAMGRMGSLGALLTAAIGGHTLASTVQMLDTLDDLNQKTGISTERLSELRYAAEVAGTPFESLTTGIRKLSVNATEAAGGNKELAATFQKMGVAVKDSTGKVRDTEAILTDVIGAFGGYEAGATKTALAVKLFGKSGEDLIPVLDLSRNGLASLTKEARDLNVVYGADLAKAAGDFNDNLARLKLVAEAASSGLLGSLVPALVEMTKQLIEGKKAYGSFVGALVDLGTLNPMKSTQENIRSTVDEIRKLNESIAETKAKLAAAEAEPKNGFTDSSAKPRKRLEQLQAELATAEARFKYLQAQAGRDAGPVGGGRGVTDPTASPKTQAPVVDAQKTKEQASEYDRLIQRLRAKLEVEKEEQKLGRDLTAGEREHMAALGELQAILAKDPSANGSRARKLIEEIFALTQINEAEKDRVKAQKALQEERDREAVSRAEELARMTDQTREMRQQLDEFGLTEAQLVSLRLARQADALAIEQERLATIALFDASGPAAQAQAERIRLMREQLAIQQQLADAAAKQSNDPMAGAMSALQEYMDHVAKAGDRTKEALKGVMDGLENNLVDFFTTGKAGWAEYVAYVLRELVRITTVQPLISGLAGAASAYFGGGTAAVQSMPAGSYSGLGTQAAGTSLGGLGLSGGRSIYQGATPVSKAVSPTGGGLVVQQQTNHFGSNVSRAEVLEGQRQANAELEWKIMRSRKYGGAL